MTESGWQAIGRIAKARRERLGLNQDELAQYGGPRVATVGKFERAAQSSFPLRTQHQMERALGWTRGVIEEVIGSINVDQSAVEDWEYELIEENIPDLGGPAEPLEEVSFSAAKDTLVAVLRLIEPGFRNQAVRAALLAMAPFLSSRGIDEITGGGDGHADNTRRSAPTKAPEAGPAQQPAADDYALAAHDDPDNPPGASEDD